jgi:hypothetical protein
LNTYKHHGSTFILRIKHVSLKELESWLIRGQIVPFLREKRPFKKSTPKSNATSGIIAGELLNGIKLPVLVLSIGSIGEAGRYSNGI